MGFWEGYEGEEDQRELTASLTQHFSSSSSYYCCTILIKRFKTFFIIEPQSYSTPASKIIDLCAVWILVRNWKRPALQTNLRELSEVLHRHTECDISLLYFISQAMQKGKTLSVLKTFLLKNVILKPLWHYRNALCNVL